MLLNDVVQAIDGVEEGRRAERKEQIQLDKRLREAWENIKNLAVQREGQRHHILTTGDNNGNRGVTDVNGQSSSKHRAKKRRISIQGAAELHDEVEEDKQLLRKHIGRQRVAEDKRFLLLER